MTGRRSSAFPQVDVPHVDKVPLGEEGHRPGPGLPQRSGDGGPEPGPDRVRRAGPTFCTVRGTPRRGDGAEEFPSDHGRDAGMAGDGGTGLRRLTSLVAALGTSSTARYEFEHNGTRERQRAGAAAARRHPAGSRPRPRRAGAAQAQPQAVDVAVRPSRRRSPAGPAGGWSTRRRSVVAGPFDDRIDADWAALADGLPAVSVHGVRRADGGGGAAALAGGAGVARRARRPAGPAAPRLGRRPVDTDPLTTLVVEVAAALLEAGLPLHDAAQGRRPAGSACCPSSPRAGSWSAGVPTTG